MIGGKLIEYQNELKWYTFIISFTMQRRLVEISRQLNNEELRTLVTQIEPLVNLERGLSAEWAYKEGLRDSYRIQREVSKFLASPSVAVKRKTRERQ